MNFLTVDFTALIAVFLPIVFFVSLTLVLIRYLNNTTDMIMDFVATKVGFWIGIIFSFFVFIGTIFQPS